MPATDPGWGLSLNSAFPAEVVLRSVAVVVRFVNGELGLARLGQIESVERVVRPVAGRADFKQHRYPVHIF